MLKSMFGKLRRAIWITMLGAAASSGCGASAGPEDPWDDELESLGTAHSALTGTVDADLYRRTSNSARYRGTGANYIECARYPFMMAYTYKNIGSYPWRDVIGRGENPGSDVKLVAWKGRKDPLSGRKFLSVDDNKNYYVRSDRKAGNCSTKPGCRRTTFNSGGLWATAPAVPGTYTSGWRLRDFSKAWSDSSKPFGPRAMLRFKIVSCEDRETCGCTVWCSDGSKLKPPAGASNCESVGKTFCEPGVPIAHYYNPCRADDGWPGFGGGSSGGSGGSAAGGGTGGWNGGTGGTGGWSGGTGGSSAGSGAGGSGGAVGFSCGGQVCQLPDIPNTQAEHCCAGDACGVTTPYMNGKCMKIPSEEELEENGYGPPELTEEDFIDPEDYIEPDVEEYRGEAIAAESGGCSTSTGGRGLGLLGPAALLALAGLRRKRRISRRPPG
jgi:hypothetical protein